MDLKALLECIHQIELLDEKRRKMMKEQKLTEEQLQEMRPKELLAPFSNEEPKVVEEVHVQNEFF